MFMYCENCGNKVDSNAYICVKCGVILKRDNNIKVIKKKGSSSVPGIISIVFGIFALIVSFVCLLTDISEVGMYTEIYERFSFALGFTFIPIVFTSLSFMLSLINKNKVCNKVGLGLSLAAAFLIITEFMVVIIY